MAMATETVVIELIQYGPSRHPCRSRRGSCITIATPNVPTVGIGIEGIKVDGKALKNTLETRMISGTALEFLEKSGESVATSREQRAIPSTKAIPVKVVVPWVMYDLCKPIVAVLRIGVGRVANSHVMIRHQA